MATRLNLREKWIPGRWVYHIEDKQQREAYKTLTGGNKHISHERLEALRTLGVKPDIERAEKKDGPWKEG